jgi:hypothetical protein
MNGMLGWLAHQAGAPPHLVAARRPQFFVASAPKTGSTWLADNLRRHPEVFVPAEKEVKYFSSLGRWLGLDWYLSRFAGGEGRIRGEASPSYASLPRERIELIRGLFPGLKVVFLLREPVSRAWSHTLHTCRHGEAHFAKHPAARLDDPGVDWESASCHEWVTLSGDYLGQLRRWLAVFPRGQVLVRFFDDLRDRPEGLFREVLAFLGADTTLSLEGFPLRQRINPGMSYPMPGGVEARLRRLWSGRTRELAGFLAREMGLRLPSSWARTLEAEGSECPVFSVAYEQRLEEALAQEEEFPSADREVCPDLEGHRVVLRGRRLLALGGEGEALEGGTLEELCQKILQRRMAEMEERLARALVLAEDARARVAALEAGLYDAGRTVQHLEKQVERLRPWYRGVGRWLMDAWRGTPAGAAR